MTVSSVKTGAVGISFALDNNYMEPIATTLVDSSGTNQITFNDIPQTYKHLHLRAILRASRNDTADGISILYNGDIASNYSSHYLRGEGASAGAGGGGSLSKMDIQDTMVGQTGGSNIFGAVIIDILDYANTNKYKTQRSLGGNDRNGAGYIDFSSGNWRNTDPITSIKIIPLYGTGFAQYSRLSLYGIKG